MKKLLLLLLCCTLAAASYAQSGGVSGKVLSRGARTPLEQVKVSIPSLGVTVTTDKNGAFELPNIAKGEYDVQFVTPEYETLTLRVRVDMLVKNLNDVFMVQDISRTQSVDDSAFTELGTDTESSGDTSDTPSTLSASKDIFNSIASYKFSDMRFRVRGYDSQYQDTYLNGVRLNDAMTGYGPWSLWTGLNDATRNQENTVGLTSNDCGLGGIGGTSNINARASQLRKGFRASVASGSSTYALRAMVTYASGAQDNGWSYAISLSTRQGSTLYTDGVYYNAFGYFASVEKIMGNHTLALTVLGAPTERGAQQAATKEAYELFGNNYYNPNVGYQNGKLRNARVRNNHEPIAMLNYDWQISENTRLRAAASMRFGKNGYSALTWADGEDPRPDYYRQLPSYYGKRLTDMQTVNNLVDMYDLGKDNRYEDATLATYQQYYDDALNSWNGYIDWDNWIRTNKGISPDSEGKIRSRYIVEERHTDQLDFNFAAYLDHMFRNGSKLQGGLNARINRTEYYDKVKDLLGGDYWLDVDKFALADSGVDALMEQNDLNYYYANGKTARKAQEGDKFGYDYYAKVRSGSLWAQYAAAYGGFTFNLGGEVGFKSMWRDGLYRKGMFPTSSFGESEHLNYLTYKAKLALAYRISGAHNITANVAYMQNAPEFRDAFVSARTRNQSTPNLKEENVFSADLTYNLNLPWIKARLSGYYTNITDQSKVISFYDDLQSSFTNFAMSGIDKTFMGLELGFTSPLGAGVYLNGAISWGEYRYTSNPNFVQIVDNSAKEALTSTVNWKNYYVESTPQKAFNIGLSYRGPHNWFASVDFNYYMDTYLSMNPMYRTQYLSDKITSLYASAMGYASFDDMWGRQKQEVVDNLNQIRAEERLDDAYTLNLSIGKSWYIHYKYSLGFSFDVKNILNNRNMETGGYEQMRFNKNYAPHAEPAYNGDPLLVKYTEYTRFDSKYFYMNGISYYLNVYFRF